MYLFKANKISVVIHVSYQCSIECFLFIVIIFMYLWKWFCSQKKIFHSKHEWSSNLFLMAFLDSQSIQGWKVSNSLFQSLSAIVNDWLINWDFWDSLYRIFVIFLFQETILALQSAFLDSQSIQGWKVSNSYWTWVQSLSALVSHWLMLLSVKNML